jgi:hypothetical protein
MRAIFLALPLFLATVLISPLPAHAAPLLVIDQGLVTGARGVDVQGTLYDVDFVDGSCPDLFTGCDDAGDFTFTTEAAATAAAQALLDQVFVNDALPLDTQPELTFGCYTVTRCDTFTMFAPFDALNASVVRTSNFSDANLDFTQSTLISLNSDFSTVEDGQVFARWSEAAVVPLPAPALLLLAGLGGLVTLRRARR